MATKLGKYGRGSAVPDVNFFERRMRDGFNGVFFH